MLLLIKKIYKEWPGFILQSGPIELASNQLVLVRGASGDGKSTLLQVLMGFEHCSEIDWSLDGIRMSDLSLSQRKMGFVFQENNLFPHLSVNTNLDLAEKRDPGPKALRARLIEDLQMGDHLLKKGRELSGGQRKRAALMQSLLGNPRIVFLDEPLVGLEEELKIVVMETISRWSQESGTPIFLASHNIQQVQPFSAAELLVSGGKVSLISPRIKSSSERDF